MTNIRGKRIHYEVVSIQAHLKPKKEKRSRPKLDDMEPEPDQVSDPLLVRTEWLVPENPGHKHSSNTKVLLLLTDITHWEVQTASLLKQPHTHTHTCYGDNMYYIVKQNNNKTQHTPENHNATMGVSSKLTRWWIGPQAVDCGRHLWCHKSRCTVVVV